MRAPRFEPGEEVWKSEIELEEGSGKVVLTTRYAEDHFWITDGSATMTTRAVVHYVNLDQPLKLVGLIADKMHGCNKAIVEGESTTSLSSCSWMEDGRFTVVCQDAKLWSELKKIGVGSWIKLYNVRIESDEESAGNGIGTIVLSKNSGVLSQQSIKK